MKLKCYYCSNLYKHEELFRLTKPDLENETTKIVLVCSECEDALEIKKTIFSSINNFFKKKKKDEPPTD